MASEYHLRVEADGAQAPVLLAEASGQSRQAIKRAMQKGAIWLQRDKGTRRLRKASSALKAGDELFFYFDPEVLEQQPLEARLISDEGAYSVWNKPCGMFSQGSKWGDHCTVQRYAEQYLQHNVFTVHRLDRAASGLILLAHEKKTAAAFSAMFRERTIDKHYRVTVRGDFRQSDISRIDAPIDERDALTEIRLLNYEEESDCSLLDVRIHTGRKHQIRRHLSGIGFPVVGDRLYGQGDSEADLQLQAFSLSFNCPLTGEPKAFSLA